MADILRMAELSESARRRAGASGVLVKLSDGRKWLLARPMIQPGQGSLTRPDIDLAFDRIHERIVLGESLLLADVMSVARELLLVNYELCDDEVMELLDVATGDEAEALTESTLTAVFGEEDRVTTYGDWVRASLLANGLGGAEIPTSALRDVLSILIATGRTVKPSRFIDVCRITVERSALERLI